MVGSLCIGSAIDEQIMKELFIGYLYFVESLKFLGINDVIDESLAETASVRIKELQPIAIDSHGFIMEWDQEYEEADPGHRHFSPLFGVYPGSSIRPDKTPDLAKAALRTLNHRISCGSSRQNSAGKTGWSRAWSSILFSRLDKSEQAWDGLVKLVGTCAFNNLCNADDLSYSNTPFQIDGNFGGLTALLEMVIRDYGDEIILLPSLPAALSKGNLCGITCKSGCTLDMVWENRQLKSLCLHGLRKGEVILRIKSEKKCISFQKNETIHALSVTQEGQLLATDKGIG
jgi:alpha-L-fucosidase 2